MFTCSSIGCFLSKEIQVCDKHKKIEPVLLNFIEIKSLKKFFHMILWNEKNQTIFSTIYQDAVLC